MADYKVFWEIDIFDCDSPEEAAQKALAIHRDPESIATVFTVRRSEDKLGPYTTVDLTPDDDPDIVANPDVLGHKTASLPSSLTVAQINKRLGFKPNVADDPDKVKHSWGFTIDGKECAIWDYKGARWSAYDPHGVLDRVFPELVKG